MPGLTLKQFASTADVEALMCSASAQQHAASSHLVLSVYVACKDNTTGDTNLSEHSKAGAWDCRAMKQRIEASPLTLHPKCRKGRMPCTQLGPCPDVHHLGATSRQQIGFQSRPELTFCLMRRCDRARKAAPGEPGCSRGGRARGRPLPSRPQHLPAGELSAVEVCQLMKGSPQRRRPSLTKSRRLRANFAAGGQWGLRL